MTWEACAAVIKPAVASHQVSAGWDLVPDCASPSVCGPVTDNGQSPRVPSKELRVCGLLVASFSVCFLRVASFIVNQLNFRLLVLVYCCCSIAQSYLTLCDPWTVACQAFLSITNSQSLLKLMGIESVMPSNHPILCCPLLLLPAIFPSIRVFSSEPVLCIRWPKYSSFSLSIGPSNEYSGLTSFRIDWLDLLAVQGTLKSLLQHHSSKASVLQCSAFYCPTLTPIHDCWKNHSFDYMDLWRQSNISAL